MPYTKPSDQAMAAAETIRTNAEARIGKIRQNTRVRPEVIRAETARVHRKAQAQMADLQARATQQAAADQLRLTRQAFGLTAPSDALSRRDAEDRTAKLQNVREAESLLAQAEATGDEVLAASIARRAYDQRKADSTWEPVLNSFLDRRPQADAAVTALLDSEQRPNITGLLAFAMPTPGELDGLAEHQIAALAAEHPDAG